MNPYLRARVIEEWRGLPDHSGKPERVMSVADGVTRLMNSLGLGERLREEEIMRTWEEIVGSFIAAHSKPSKLQDGLLIVQVLQPTMHYELDRVWKRKILSMLKERFGSRTVKDVRFRIG